MPVKREGPTLKQVILQVLADMAAPALVDDLVRSVLERYPATAKNPAKRVCDQLHSNDVVGAELVYLDPRTIVPLRLAMPGICFRVPLGHESAHIINGVLKCTGARHLLIDLVHDLVYDEHRGVKWQYSTFMMQKPTFPSCLSVF